MNSVDVAELVKKLVAAYAPGTDVSDSSEFGQKVLLPLKQRLADGFYETDFYELAKDRVAKEHPSLSTGDLSVLTDLAIKPAATLLNEVRAEASRIRSASNTEESDALTLDEAKIAGKTFLVPPRQATYSAVTVRLYFASPRSVTFDADSVYFATEGGKRFTPSREYAISAQQMAATRTGSRYYADIPCEATVAGPDGQVSAGDITRVEGFTGHSAVENLTDSSPALGEETLVEFEARLRKSLSERSMTTVRGIVPRVFDIFPTVKAVEVVGRGDPEMLRDKMQVVTGSREIVSLGILLSPNQYLGFTQFGDRPPEVGDGVEFLFSAKDYATAPPTQRSKVSKVLFSTGDAETGVHFVEVDEPVAVPTQPAAFGSVFIGTPVVNAAFGKPSTIQFSEGQFGEEGDHLGGCIDVYLEPTADSKTSTVLDMGSATPAFTGVNCQTTEASSAIVLDEYKKIRPGMIIRLISGNDAGFYRVLMVNMDEGEVIVDVPMGTDATNVIYQVFDDLPVDLFSPKNLKVPFGLYTASDLKTLGGSSKVSCSAEVLEYGVVVGDLLRIKQGPSSGIYGIKTIEFSLGKTVITLDAPMAASETSVAFEIYAESTGLLRPLRRIKPGGVQLLDSTGASAGVTIPPADPVGGRLLSQAPGIVKGSGVNGFVLPDLSMHRIESGMPGIPADYDPSVLAGVSFEVSALYTKRLATMMGANANGYLGFETTGRATSFHLPLFCLTIEVTKTTAARTASAITSNDFVVSNDALALPRANQYLHESSTKRAAVITAGISLASNQTVVEVLDNSNNRVADAANASMPFQNAATTIGTGLVFFGPESLADLPMYGDPSITARTPSGSTLVPEREANGNELKLTYRVGGTVTEFLVPKSLFDGSKNIFVGLPEFDVSAMIEFLGAGKFSISSGSSTLTHLDRSNAPKSLPKILPSELLRSQVGDDLIIPSGDNAGVYKIKSIRPIKVLNCTTYVPGESSSTTLREVETNTLNFDLALVEVDRPFVSTKGDQLFSLLNLTMAWANEAISGTPPEQLVKSFWDFVASAVPKDYYTQLCGPGVVDTPSTYVDNPSGATLVFPQLPSIKAPGKAATLSSVVGDVLEKFPEPFLTYLVKSAESLASFKAFLSFETGGPSPQTFDLAQAIEDFLRDNVLCRYSFGKAPSGVARLYWTEPVTTEFWSHFKGPGASTADPVTLTFSGTPSGALARPFTKWDPPTSLKYKNNKQLGHRLFFANIEDSAPVFPAKETLAADELPRGTAYNGISMGQISVTFGVDNLNLAAAGVRPGDILEVHPEKVLLPDVEASQVYGGLICRMNSNKVEIPSKSRANFSPGDEGSFLFLEGSNAGGYRIERVVSSKEAVLDKVLRKGTAVPITLSGVAINGVASLTTTNASSSATLVSESAIFTPAIAGKKITLFLNNQTLGFPNGTYTVASYTNPTTVVLTLRNAASSSTTYRTDFIAHSATTDDGVSRFKMYQGRPVRYRIVTPTNTDVAVVVPADGSAAVSEDPVFDGGSLQPFQIVRDNCLKMTAADMEKEQEDGLFFRDIPFSAHDGELGIAESEYFDLLPGTFLAEGYRLRTSSPGLSFSAQERTEIILPGSILSPLDPSPQYSINIAGSKVSVEGEYSPDARSADLFLQSRLERSLTADTLIKRMLPAFVYLTIQTTGGDLQAAYKLLSEYMASLSPTDYLSAYKIQGLLQKAGVSSVQQGFTLNLLVQDLERKNYLYRSTNKIGIDSALETFHVGSHRIWKIGSSPLNTDESTLKVGEQIRFVSGA